MMMGASQNFFLTLRKDQNSPTIDNLLFLDIQPGLPSFCLAITRLWPDAVPGNACQLRRFRKRRPKLSPGPGTIVAGNTIVARSNAGQFFAQYQPGVVFGMA